MDSDSECMEAEKPIEVIFEAEVEESEDPPMEEWSSLEIEVEETNPKKILYEHGLYDPGSGEICAEYIAQSASSVIRHPYYRYPAIIDPGIIKALTKPPDPLIYPDDGQELYLAVCKNMNQCPVRSFYRGLLQSQIDLRYYGVNPNGVRAMALALQFNKIVKLLNFTDNFLNVDACFHLGEMLVSNNSLVELNLSGCRIGADGARMLLANMPHNRTLRALNLSGNDLGDAGMQYFTDAVFKGLEIKMVDLSHNNISGKGVAPLAEAFETHNKITHWNLAWNNLYAPGTYNFLTGLATTTQNLKKIDLSWNSLSGPRVAQGIRSILLIKALKHVNLSNNKLEGEAIKIIMGNLTKAKKLVSLNFSYNPMTPEDAVFILRKAKLKTTRVRRIYMDNVNVNKMFLKLLNEMKTAKPESVVTYGGKIGAFQPVGKDPRELLLNRADFLCKKPKKNKADIALLVLRLQKENDALMLGKDFCSAISRTVATVDGDLLDEIVNTWAGPRDPKGGQTINLKLLADYLQRKWPERKLPPTPPPEPEPQPVVVAKKDEKAKEKKGKK